MEPIYGVSIVFDDQSERSLSICAFLAHPLVLHLVDHQFDYEKPSDMGCVL